MYKHLENHKDKNAFGYRVVKTARNLEAINEAVRAGFTPVIRKLMEPCYDFSFYKVIQNKTTREITVKEQVAFEFGWYPPR